MAKAIAKACFLLVTFLPLLDLSSPSLNSDITFFTLSSILGHHLTLWLQ